MLKKLLTIKNVILLISLGLILRSGVYLFIYTMSQVMYQKDELSDPGIQFAHFKKHLKGQESIGFLTDKDMSSESNDGFFSQTQYILAPIIVELNQPGHEFNIIDFNEPKNIILTMRRLNSRRVDNNEYGQALIRRLPFKK